MTGNPKHPGGRDPDRAADPNKVRPDKVRTDIVRGEWVTADEPAVQIQPPLTPENAAPWRPKYNPWLIALVVTMATFMEVLDTSIANVALPHIAGNLSAGEDESTWVLTSYLVANAIVLPLNGWLSAIIGRKRFYMMSVALFTVSSLLCGLAPSLGVLVLFRILQGIGGGGLQPAEQAILMDTFPREKRGMGMAVYGVAVVTAPIIGPTLGGWITDNFNWRWVFLINIPVGLMSLLLTSRLVQDPPYLVRKAFKSVRFDYVGLGLVAVGLGFLQLMLDKGQRADWFDSNYITMYAIIAALALVTATIWEYKQREPIVDLHLLRDRNFLVANMLMFSLGFVLYGSTALLPLFLQKMMGYSATLSGMALSPGGLVTMFMFPVAGFLLGKVGPRLLVFCGLSVLSLSMFHMAGFSLDMNFGTAVSSRAFQSLSLAFLFVPINVLAYAFLPREKNNAAAGLINLSRNLGGSFGIAFVTTMLARQIQVHQNNLSAHLTPYDSGVQTMLRQTTHYFMSQGSSATEALGQAHGTLYGMLVKHAAMLAYLDDFRVMGFVILTMIPLLLLLKKTAPPKPGEVAAH